MRIIVLTSNHLRHKYVANTLCRAASEALIFCEAQPLPWIPLKQTADSKITPIDDHFKLRDQCEKDMFQGHEAFAGSVIPMPMKQINSEEVVDHIRRFDPDLAFIFGSSLIRKEILDLLPSRFINMHLGLSPFYRGAGTNFWPCHNDEPEFVGATILITDPGVDTGEIVCHVRPTIEAHDTVHTLGCKTIQKACGAFIKCLNHYEKKRTLPSQPQWEVPDSHYYRARDFDEGSLSTYLQLLEGGMMERATKRETPQGLVRENVLDL